MTNHKTPPSSAEIDGSVPGLVMSEELVVPLSACCSAEMKTEEDHTWHYVCSMCEQECDPKQASEVLPSSAEPVSATNHKNIDFLVDIIDSLWTRGSITAEETDDILSIINYIEYDHRKMRKALEECSKQPGSARRIAHQVFSSLQTP